MIFSITQIAMQLRKLKAADGIGVGFADGDIEME